MNFFDAQDRSRRNTRRLIFLYALATLLIVTLVTGIAVVLFSQPWSPTGPGLSLAWLQQNSMPMLGVAGGTAGFIGLSSAYKIARLSGGGARVALDMGGTAVSSDAQDPLRKRLRNVVEEMAIASGVPVPKIYVLEQESGINAFAAGFSPEDAAIAVTRGTLELLDRDELQGVVAHEFSHILNGDMRLNIRLMGVLFGILAIGIIGRLILRSSRRTSFGRSSGKGNGAAVGLALGLALFLIGYVGVFIGRMIKAGVSRQREFLADASAVQFTRQSTGIAGALKKIGGFQQGSRIQATDSEEVSHMLFALGSKRLSGLFATHPPLEDRIRALDASFKPDEFTRSSTPQHQRASAEASLGADMSIAPISAFQPNVSVDADTWLANSGQPAQRHVEFAGRIRRSVPELLTVAAHSRDQSTLLAVALVLDGDKLERERQLAFLSSRLGPLRARRVAELYDEFAALGDAYRLPLLDIAFPALKDRPAPQVEFLIELVDELIVLDGKVDLFEYAFARVLQSQLSDALAPRRAMAGRQKLRGSRRQLTAARDLLAIFAYRGHESESQSHDAYRLGLSLLPLSPSQRERWGDIAVPADWVRASDESLSVLNQLNGSEKRELLESLIKVASFDNGLSTAEAEMLRAIAAVLQCPLTPLLNESDLSRSVST